MHHESLGMQSFVDKKNKIRCRITFGSERKGIPSDYFEGGIERFDPENPEAEGGEILSNVEGSWVGYVDFDKVMLFVHGREDTAADGLALLSACCSRKSGIQHMNVSLQQYLLIECDFEHDEAQN